MRRIALFVAAITLLCSCAGWQATAWKTVDGAQKAGESLVQSAMPVINAVCDGELSACEESQDPECPGWRACAAIRRNVVRSFVLEQIACADAEAAIAIGNKEDVAEAVADVLRLLQEIRTQLKQTGVLK